MAGAIRRQFFRLPYQVGMPAPQVRAEAQGLGVVVGGVAAFAPQEAVNGMLDQPGRVRHAIQVVQGNPVTDVPYIPP